ncbi:MAG: hypothetical protein OEV51_01210 [Nitrospira sp.]|nr:hypothetical protein [Nitrospira sp.]
MMMEEEREYLRAKLTAMESEIPRHQRVCGPGSQAGCARSNQRRAGVARRFDAA